MLRTYGSIPCWRIVFSTFRRCMSFYKTWTLSGPTHTAGCAGAGSVCKWPVQFRAPVRGIGGRLRTDRVYLPQVFGLLVAVRLHPLGEFTPRGREAVVRTAVH